jgi:hypothetical protein
MTAKQWKCKQGPEIDYSAGGYEANSQISSQDLKNVYQDIVEKLATAQAKEEATHSWGARDTVGPATLGSSPHTNQKRRNGGTLVGYSG